MSGELVTVAYEISSLNANLIRTRLEADGIRCFVAGETLSSVVGLPGYVGANIEVQVQAFDALRARRILREIRNDSREENDDEQWLKLRPSFAAQIVRGVLIGSLIWSAAWMAYSLINTWGR